MFTRPFALRHVAAVAAAFVAAAVAADARAATLDLDSLSHGDVVRDQFAGDGISVRARNLNKPVGDMYNMAVLFDTNTSEAAWGDDDPDLRPNWDRGNLPSTHNVGKILIIQERNNGVDTNQDQVPDYVTVPDDEGGRPAGNITIEWINGCLIDTFAFTLIDIEGSEEAFSVEFFGTLGSTMVGISDGDDLGFGAVDFGNNSINRVGFDADSVGVGAWSKVVFHFGGSGGVGELEYTKTHQAPAPAALPAGLALLSAAAVRRRRRTA